MRTRGTKATRKEKSSNQSRIRNATKRKLGPIGDWRSKLRKCRNERTILLNLEAELGMTKRPIATSKECRKEMQT